MAAVALVVGLRVRVLVVLIDAGDPAGVAVPAAEVTVSPGAWPTAEAAGGAMTPHNYVGIAPSLVDHLG